MKARTRKFGPLPWAALALVGLAGVAVAIYLHTSSGAGPCSSVEIRLESARALHRHLFSIAPSASSALLSHRPGTTTRGYFGLLEKECMKGASGLPLVASTPQGFARVAEVPPTNLMWRVLLPPAGLIRAESPFFLSANVQLASVDGRWEVEIAASPAWPCTETFVTVHRGGHGSVRPYSELANLRQELNASPVELLPP